MAPTLATSLMRATRLPLILFRHGGNANKAVATTADTASPSLQPSLKPSSHRCAGIDEAALPPADPRFQRKPIDDAEISAINSGCAY